MAKAEPRHTAAPPSPFPQLFPTAPSPPTTVSPSLAAFLLPDLPSPSPAHCWKMSGGHREPTGEG